MTRSTTTWGTDDGAHGNGHRGIDCRPGARGHRRADCGDMELRMTISGGQAVPPDGGGGRRSAGSTPLALEKRKEPGGLMCEDGGRHGHEA